MQFKVLRFLFLHLAIFLCLASSGCGKKGSSETYKTLRTAFYNEPQTVNPCKCSDFTSSNLVCLLFDGLTRVSQDNEYQLSIAKKIETSSNGLVYTFYLKKTFWNDGTAVTAHDFERSWKKSLNKQSPSPCAFLFYCIKNAENYLKGFCSDSDVGIHCLSDEVLVVHLERPTPYFLNLLSFPSFFPLAKDVDPDTAFWENKPDNFICNGPFTISTALWGDKIVLKKNPSYHKSQDIKLQQINFKILKDETLALNLFLQGELDLLGGAFYSINFEKLKKLDPSHTIKFIDSAATTFISFNTQSKLFSNKEIRSAIFSAIVSDPSLMSEIENLNQLRPETLLPPSLRSGFPSKQNLQNLALPDPKKQLDIALEKNNLSKKDFEKIKLYFRPSPLEKKIAQIIQSILHNKLQIHIKLEQADSKTLMNRLYVKDYDICFSSWIAQFHDPINILDRFKFSQNAKNYTAWSDADFANLLNSSFESQNKETRLHLLSSAEDLLTESLAIIPLYHWKSPVLLGKKIQNFTTANCGYIILENCDIEN